MANIVKVNFNESFKGELIAPNGKVSIGSNEGELLPYDLLLGGLASCVHATFLGIARKKRITYDTITYDIEGIKREEVPTTLKDVYVNVTFTNASDKEKIDKSMELACRYCSIYQTLANVAEMHLKIEHK